MADDPSIFLTADTHFGHANIVRYAKRPFASVEEHDEMLIVNWNMAVRPKDIVYHLGDFAFRSREAAANYRRRLNGQIFLIEGNHDSAARQICEMFESFKQVHEFSWREHRFFLSHYAHRTWNRSHHGAFHCYGHSHNSLPDDPHARSMDVGVDAVAALLGGRPAGQAWDDLDPDDYRPIRIEEVVAHLSKREFKPIDHHGRDADKG